MTKDNNNFENLINLTNNPDIKNLLGNFVKVVNTNLEKSINNQQEYSENNKSSDEDSDEESYNYQRRYPMVEEEEEIHSRKKTIETDDKSINTDDKNNNFDNFQQINIKEFLVDKNGNNIADILSNISNNIAKNNQILESLFRKNN